MNHEDNPSVVRREILMRMLASEESGRAASQLAEVSEDVRYEAGATIYAAGELADTLRVLVSGEVVLEAPGRTPRLVSAPSILGFFDVVHRAPYAETAVARLPVHTLALRDEDWFDALEDDVDSCRSMFARLGAALLATRLTLPDGGFDPPASAKASVDAPMDTLARIVALRGARALQGAAVASIAELAKHARAMTLAPRDVLYEEGAPLDALFFVGSGVVRIDRAHPRLTARFSGEALGGLAPLAATRAPFSATAETRATVLAVDYGDLFDVIEDKVDLIRVFLMALTSEMREAQDQARASTARA